MIDSDTHTIIENTFFKDRVDAKGEPEDILATWFETMNKSLRQCGSAKEIGSIAVAMPGPFKYEEGICVIEGTYKYDRLFGINIRNAIENNGRWEK